MANNEISFWGIHAGKTVDADNLFLKKNYVAVGWKKMSDLSAILPDRESFKVKVLEGYPDSKPGVFQTMPDSFSCLYTE